MLFQAKVNESSRSHNQPKTNIIFIFLHIFLWTFVLLEFRIFLTDSTKRTLFWTTFAAWAVATASSTSLRMILRLKLVSTKFPHITKVRTMKFFFTTICVFMQLDKTSHCNRKTFHPPHIFTLSSTLAFS